jgi:hypothetical protein
MRIAAKLALVLLAAATPTAGAAQRGAPIDYLYATYDPAPRTTDVSVILKDGKNSTPGLRFLTSHPDSLPSRPMEQFQLTLAAGLRTPEPPRFAGVREATLLVDDSVEIRLEGEHRPGRWTETVTFPVSLSQALRLGAARSVEGRIGSWEFQLAPWEIARIGRLLAFARLDRDAPEPFRVTVLPPGEFSGTIQAGP